MKKGIIACYLLMSTMGFGVTLTAGAYSTKDDAKLADALLNIVSMQDDDSYKPTTKKSQSNENVDSIAEIQGVFNVLAQVDLERAKLMGRKNSLIPFWTGLVKSLWNKGKSYLKKNVCYSKEQAMEALLQELTSEEMGTNDIDDTNSNDDEEVRAQLQVLFNALQKVKANMMQEGNSVKTESLDNSITDKIKSITKNLLC